MGGPILVLGLGNPGSRFDGSRHNVGYDLVTRLAGRIGVRLRPIPFRRVKLGRTDDAERPILALPTTFMNRSGQVLPWLQRKTGVDANHLLVAVDNMDLPVGEIRMKTRGGPAQHNGLRSVSATLGSDDFARIYIGIGRPNEGVSVTDHVLSAPDADEQRLIHDAIDRAVPILDKAPVHEFDDLVRRINDVRRPAE